VTAVIVGALRATEFVAMTTDHSAESFEQKLQVILCGEAPPEEILRKARVASEIVRLKRERNAIILGHNYMEPALYHTIPDFTGDSLELSRRAAETDADLIVFCGVRFMAETAKILNPSKRVLLPSLDAGCSLAAGITADDVRALRARFPGAPVVSYVNTYADVKAESDVCCTSGNAASIVAALDAPQIIFLPDRFLAANVATTLGRTITFASRDGELTVDDPGAQIIGWRATCEVHAAFTVDDICEARWQHPGVAVLAHPECPPAVVARADFSGSTSAMIRYVEEHDADSFLLLTECSMADNIVAAHPDKRLLRMCHVRCPYMRVITLEQTLDALRHERHEIVLDDDVMARARRAVETMIECT
jgi:quinolinate synthase